MHELQITKKILDIALDHGRNHGVSKIHSIVLRLGGLTDFKESWLQHYFSYISKGTMAEEAKLVIMAAGITLRCGRCKTIIDTEETDLEQVHCPHCRASEGFSLLSGREFMIEEMVAE